jgi:succinate-semialdehyde dehydrogenase/glutarate-semialdehyde dehydrogenase
MATEYLSLSFKFINMISINPYTKEEIATYTEFSPDEMIQLIEKNHQAFLKWKQRSYNDRSPHFRNLAKLLREQKEKLGRIITAEMGKIFSESVAEIEKCAWLCEYYADNTETLLKPEFYEADTTKSYVRFDPIGPVYGIMPWNFPFWQALRAAVPTMMAGNSFLLKHAPNVQGCAVAMENLFIEAGFPKYLFANLIISIELSDEVIANPLVQGVTLTGSRRAGQAVASVAGRHLKKSVMELGGSDPYIVLADAEFNESCKTGVCSRMLNGGQVCIAAKRFIVVEEVFDQFVEEQKALLENMWLGDPMLENTDMGPMARLDLLEGIEKQVNQSINMGAKILTGGKRLNDKSWFYKPTLITNVNKGMPVYDEETFGPVSVVIKAKDAEDAIRISNDSMYGLGASLWTQDIEQAEELAAKIDAGAVFINGMVKSDPRLPFGGTKQSGFGRELGNYGIKEFTNMKTVWVK